MKVAQVLSPKRLASFAYVAAILVLVGLLSSCGAVKKTKTTFTSMFGSEVQVEIEVDSELNMNSALAVELVLVEDPKLAPRIAALTAREWFENREQFKRDNKKGWTSKPWEFVPGQKIDPQPQTVRVKSGTRDAFVFADYFAPGTHRERLESPRKHFTLHLGRSAFWVDPSD